jgi:adenosylhomocysteinase
LRALERDGRLGFPIVAVNEANTKHLFDNRYGTGQSTIDGILRATNVLLAGRTFVICGYGWCGRGLADRARGLGAHVVVIEVDPLRALQAVMDGFRVMNAEAAAGEGEIFFTATGNLNIFGAAHFPIMRDGAILANAGHFDAEINLAALSGMAESRETLKPFVEEYTLPDRRKLVVLAEGRLVNLGAAEGHPAAVMDMSFANQALAAEYVVQHHAELERRVYGVPPAIDAEVARLKLAAFGINLDGMTPEQAAYVTAWKHGT